MDKQPEHDKILEEKYERIDKLVKTRMIGVQDKVLIKIYKEFGGRIFRRASAPLDYSEKVLAMAMTTDKVKTAIEIGTLNGIVTAVMTQFCDKVVTFDIEDLKLKYKIWRFLGIEKKIEFHLIKNELEKEQILNKLDFDFVYMDGNHLSHTVSDYMMCRKCGRIFFHEALRVDGQVDLLLKSLPENKVKYYRLGFKLSDTAYWNSKGHK